MKKHLKIVSNAKRPSSLTSCEHDLHLPKLGKMRFVMTSSNDDGVYLLYIKDEDFVACNFDEYREGVPTMPYCYTKVTLNEWERFFGRKMSRKIKSKIQKLKNWVIEQDILLGLLEGRNRKVNL